MSLSTESIDLFATSPTEPSGRLRCRSTYDTSPFKDDDGTRPISTTIRQPIQTVFDILTNMDSLPYFLESLERVELDGESKYKWYFKNKVDSSSDFSVYMSSTYVQNSSVIYSVTDEGGYKYKLSIELLPAQSDRGTIVRMKTSYETFAGVMAGRIEKLFGKDAEMLTKKNLHRFKAFCETGSVPTIEGQTSGRETFKENTHLYKEGNSL